MPKKTQFSPRRGERGQTLVLVAISIVSLLAMAALAIDVVTLYVARSEIQRAADAAALAGAKAIADSGVTTIPTSDSHYTDGSAQLLASTMATAAINAVLQSNQNLVSAAAPQWTNGPPAAITYNDPTASGLVNNPQVTVALKRTNLPTFFARIFGRTGATVTASATAEAYNPANLSSFTPIAPKCVKPWLVANTDPYKFPLNLPTDRLIDPATGSVEPGVLTDLSFDLTADCPTCTNKDNPPKALAVGQVEYLAAAVVGPNSICPACAGGSSYEQGIECCDANTYAYLYCGGGVANAQWGSSIDLSGGASGLSATGAECLIHASTAGPGQGQDVLGTDPPAWPSAPVQFKAQSGPQNGNLVSTSSSIVTIPIIDNTSAIAGNVTIVGFLQAFIRCVEDGAHKKCDQPGTATAGDINIQIVNVIGCSSSPSAATPIVGGNGTSPISVRLITPP